MREKAKELQRQRMEAAKKGVKPSFGSSGGFGSSSGYTPSPSVGDTANISNDIKPPTYIAPQYVFHLYVFLLKMMSILENQQAAE